MPRRIVLPPRILGLRTWVHVRDWLLMGLAIGVFTAAAMLAVQSVANAVDESEAMAEAPPEGAPAVVPDSRPSRATSIVIALGLGVVAIGSLVVAFAVVAARHSRTRVCANHGMDVIVRISDTRVVHRRGQPTRRRVYTVVPIDAHDREGPPFTVAIDLDRRTPLFADPTERTAFALYNDGDEPHLILLCHDLEPFDLTADEKADAVRRAIAARAATPPFRNDDGPARGRPV